MNPKTFAPSLLLLLLAGLAACAAPSEEEPAEDPDEAISEIGTKAPPSGINWSEATLPRGGLDGKVTIDDVAFLERPDGTPVTRDGGKPTVFVLERLGFRALPISNENTGWTDPGIALLLKSTDGGATFETVAQLPGLGYPAKIHLSKVARDRRLETIYIEAPGEHTGLRGGLASYHATLLRSDNGGYAWTTLPGGVNDVAVDANNAKTLTGIDCRGLLKSTDGGHAWNVVTQGSGVEGCEAARLVRAKDPSRFYAVFHIGELGFPTLYRSNDAGVTFRMIDQPEATYPRTSMEVDALDPNHVWAWDFQGFASSSDGAKTFHPHNRGLVSLNEWQNGGPLSNIAIDDLHRPPGAEKHTLWFANRDRIVRWSPESGPEGGQWKEVSRVPVPGAGEKLFITGRTVSPKPFVVVKREGESEVLLRGEFVY